MSFKELCQIRLEFYVKTKVHDKEGELVPKLKIGSFKNQIQGSWKESEKLRHDESRLMGELYMYRNDSWGKLKWREEEIKETGNPHFSYSFARSGYVHKGYWMGPWEVES